MVVKLIFLHLVKICRKFIWRVEDVTAHCLRDLDVQNIAFCGEYQMAKGNGKSKTLLDIYYRAQKSSTFH